MEPDGTGERLLAALAGHLTGLSRPEPVAAVVFAGSATIGPAAAAEGRIDGSTAEVVRPGDLERDLKLVSSDGRPGVGYEPICLSVLDLLAPARVGQQLCIPVARTSRTSPDGAS